MQDADTADGSGGNLAATIGSQQNSGAQQGWH